MLTETILEDPRWQEVDLPALAERAALFVFRHQGLAPDGHSIAVLGCDDARIATLNADFRGKPSPTNVLSWPSEDLGADTPGHAPRVPQDPDLGDIAISFDTCAREAQAAGRPMVAHVTHLVVHAVLHLLGYDHIHDADAARMEALEVAVLARMGLPDPYA